MHALLISFLEDKIKIKGNLATCNLFAFGKCVYMLGEVHMWETKLAKVSLQTSLERNPSNFLISFYWMRIFKI